MNRISIFLTLLTLSIVLNSCSNSSEGCSETLEPVGNEFTYNCDIYTTEVGRFWISSPYEGHSLCKMQFVNSSYGDFSIYSGDTNIILATIEIIVPPESYSTHEIPSGTYNLKAVENTPTVNFDILQSQIIYNGTAQFKFAAIYIVKNVLENEDFNGTVVTISKSGNIYTIEYSLTTVGNKIIKGKFIGEMGFVHYN